MNNIKNYWCHCIKCAMVVGLVCIDKLMTETKLKSIKWAINVYVTCLSYLNLIDIGDRHISISAYTAPACVLNYFSDIQLKNLCSGCSTTLYYTFQHNRLLWNVMWTKYVPVVVTTRNQITIDFVKQYILYDKLLF